MRGQSTGAVGAVTRCAAHGLRADWLSGILIVTQSVLLWLPACQCVSPLCCVSLDPSLASLSHAQSPVTSLSVTG